MAPAIPDRWNAYKAIGNVIEGTRIIAFKVPLRRRVQASSKNIWDIKALVKAIPKLCAVIDLTNTYRYYDPKELNVAGILHKKILLPGRIIPPDNEVTEFFDAVDNYLRMDNDSLIGVHCTHGLNRTGYMVCRYMRDRLGIPAQEAISRFETARGYKMERQNYIADLVGKTPPPPDVGKNTTVTPISDKSEVKYTSPLKCYDDMEQHNSDRIRMSNNKHPCKSKHQHEGGSDEIGLSSKGN